jgi:geranylgeranyl diphosphate synthase type II
MGKLEKINQAIVTFYSQNAVSIDLVGSIMYSVNAGGKRIRPLIFLDILEGFGFDLTDSHYQVAASVEMIHTGSLIHDDLPAMDNDDYRRGILTNHKKFDEATAILAGDSLFLDPFALITETDLSDKIKVSLIRELSYASGTYGMVGGQMLDIAGEKSFLNLEALQKIHANKTGKLLTFPFVAAGIVADLGEDDIKLLRKTGELIGLAFQIRDDILDVTASFEEIGKTPQKDLAAEKSTYPSLLGLQQSYSILGESLNQALEIFEKIKETKQFNSKKISVLIERLRLHV